MAALIMRKPLRLAIFALIKLLANNFHLLPF